MKNLLIGTICLSLLFSSCDNDEYNSLSEIYRADTRSLIENARITTDSLTSVSDSLQMSPFEIRAYVDSRIIKGYAETSIYNKNADEYYSKTEADRRGIGPGTYYLDYYNVRIVLYTKDGEEVRPTSSPNCGLIPGGDRIKRGYAYLLGDSTYCTLVTQLEHIKYDELGRSIDVWYPTKPENLIWNYDIYIPYWNINILKSATYRV